MFGLSSETLFLGIILVILIGVLGFSLLVSRIILKR
jgi:hypothetical protein